MYMEDLAQYLAHCKLLDHRSCYVSNHYVWQQECRYYCISLIFEFYLKPSRPNLLYLKEVCAFLSL